MISWLDNMYDSTCVFLLAETLKHKIITLWLIILNKIVLVSLALVLSFYHEWVSTFAYFTLEGLPEECIEVALQLGLLASLQPCRQALVMNLSDGACAFARTK